MNETKSVLPGDAGTQLLESEANSVGEIMGGKWEEYWNVLFCILHCFSIGMIGIALSPCNAFTEENKIMLTVMEMMRIWQALWHCSVPVITSYLIMKCSFLLKIIMSGLAGHISPENKSQKSCYMPLLVSIIKERYKLKIQYTHMMHVHQINR